jgi:hypothetical protein
LAQDIIDHNLRSTIKKLEQADMRCDYAVMLGLPAQHHKVLGRWIETSALAYT